MKNKRVSDMETIKCCLGKSKQQAEGQLLPRCSICNNVPEHGIADGLKLRHAFICKACEERIVLVDVGSMDYEFLMEKIKKLWKP